jgi:hypothetical protein
MQEFTIGVSHVVRTTYLVKATDLANAVKQAELMHERKINHVEVDSEPLFTLPQTEWTHNRLASSRVDQSPIPAAVIEEYSQRENVSATESNCCGGESCCTHHETTQVS